MAWKCSRTEWMSGIRTAALSFMELLTLQIRTRYPFIIDRGYFWQFLCVKIPTPIKPLLMSFHHKYSLLSFGKKDVLQPRGSWGLLWGHVQSYKRSKIVHYDTCIDTHMYTRTYLLTYIHGHICSHINTSTYILTYIHGHICSHIYP